MYTLNSLAYEFSKNYKGNNSLNYYKYIINEYNGLDWCKLIKHNFNGEYNKQLIFSNNNKWQ